MVFAEPLAESDRSRLLSELHASGKQLLDSISGLTQAQWNYKAAPDRWSIKEVTEHITTAEPYLRGLAVKSMSGPVDEAKAAKRKDSNAKTDEAILAMLRNRSQKASAPGELVPRGIYATPADAEKVFKAEREKTLEYVRTTKDDLRGHFVSPQPNNEMDGVQFLLLLAGHNERHVLQIEEVKQSPGYPKR